MIVVRFFGAFFIILSCFLTGYIPKKKFQIAILEIENFITCIDIFNIEVQNGFADVFDALGKAAAQASFMNNKILSSFIDLKSITDSKTLCERWEENLFNHVNECLYNKNELNIIQKFGSLLGKGDEFTQDNNVDALKKSLSIEIEKRRENIAKKDMILKIYLYMGVLVIIILL